MKKEELIKLIQKYEPLLANAVSHMVEYIQDNYSAAYPSKVQTEAVNDYLRSVYADGDGSMSERNCEHRRIASQNITIAAIRILDSRQLDRLQDVLDHIAYDKEYYNFTIADIEKLTNVRVERNKRNGRTQEQHMEVMRAIQTVTNPNWRKGNGRPSAQQRV